jgi:branched-chain amino acid transport system permease protein
MTAQAQTTTRSNAARGRRSPRTILRNAFITTFMIFLAMYPVFDSFFGWGKMGAMPAILIYTLLALGLNIVVGFAGLLDLGYVAFFAIGGYTAAFLTSPVSPIAGIVQVNFYVAMVLAFLVAAIFGIILGAPTLRLRGDYLAIVTLAFGEIVPRTFLNLEGITRGSKGMIAIGRPDVPVVDTATGALVVKELYNQDQTAWYYLIFIIGAISVFAIYRLQNSRQGRAWMAMREDELAAASMGIDLIQTKLLAFALGASFAGFAGSLWASMLQVIDPFQFDFSTSIIVLSMIILGGIGNIWGVIFGGFVLGFYDRILTADLTNWVHQLGAAINIPIISNMLMAVDFSQYKYGIFGVALVLLMNTRPEGIFPNRQRAMELHDDTPEEVEELSEEALAERTVGGVRA